MRTGGLLNTTSTGESVQHSPWHSPVPYLFGGLAAMLGLIAFALLILACSYWKLSGSMENGEEGERDLENGGNGGETVRVPPVFEEKIVVIMAGDQKPTFLATPMSSRASSFGDNIKNNHPNNNNKESDKSEKSEKPKQETDHDQEQTTENMETQLTREQNE
ncbi:hypothetical protein HHK36_013684 [Tetracentron sinense]|uniref:Uncharacterized protein n=1 Tax=Tetracentron sinense TaxID=13715 RepID=A0A834ZAU1_TETSI|nr:hypothetical protein HHK36_013684 [Tetracentron sinense]